MTCTDESHSEFAGELSNFRERSRIAINPRVRAPRGETIAVAFAVIVIVPSRCRATLRRKRAADNPRFPLSGVLSPAGYLRRAAFDLRGSGEGKEKKSARSRRRAIRDASRRVARTHRQRGVLRGVLASTVRSSSIRSRCPLRSMPIAVLSRSCDVLLEMKRSFAGRDPSEPSAVTSRRSSGLSFTPSDRMPHCVRDRPDAGEGFGRTPTGRDLAMSIGIGDDSRVGK